MFKQFSSKIFETIFLQKLWNKFPPKSLKIFSSKTFETIFLQNLWNIFPPKSVKQFFSSNSYLPTILQSYIPTLLRIMRPIRNTSPFLGLHARATNACTSPRTQTKLHGKGKDTYTDGNHDSMKELANWPFLWKTNKIQVSQTWNLNDNKI